MCWVHASPAGVWCRLQVDALQAVIEKAVIMGLATGSKKASSALSELLTSYASILAAQVCSCLTSSEL